MAIEDLRNDEALNHALLMLRWAIEDIAHTNYNRKRVLAWVDASLGLIRSYRIRGEKWKILLNLSCGY